MRPSFLSIPLVGLLLAACAPGSELPSAPASVAALRATASGYTRIELPLQDAWGVNDNGLIVGYVKGVGAYWLNGTRKVLLPPAPPYHTYMAANVSEKGSVVGSKFGGNNANYRALFWPTVTSAPIELPDLGGVSTQAMDVNSPSVVVGVSRAVNGQWHAYKWTKSGGMIDLHPKGYLSSTAMRINDEGYIVGFADSPGPTAHRDGIRWRPDGTIDVHSTADPVKSGLYGLNSVGDASGQNPSFGATIYWLDNSLQFVGGPLGIPQARALTDLYRVVGTWTDPNNMLKPWTSRKGIETLLPIGATESGSTADANTCGWVVGWSYFQTGTNYTMAGTLWKPSNCD
ncbi:MAG: hypothetical protein ABI587_08235 [Gemmatimonadales bacterium]